VADTRIHNRRLLQPRLLFRSLITMVYSLLAIGIDIQALKEAVFVDIGVEVTEVELVGKSEHFFSDCTSLIETSHTDEYCKVCPSLFLAL
jgi:hypothetical protein